MLLKYLIQIAEFNLIQANLILFIVRYTPSHYSTSGYVSSYGTLPRYNRSQTPSYIGRERNYTSNRENKSVSRFSTDRVIFQFLSA